MVRSREDTPVDTVDIVDMHPLADQDIKAVRGIEGVVNARTPLRGRSAHRRGEARRGALAAIVVLAPLLGVAAGLASTSAPAAATTAGPDPTLVVGTLPSAANPSTTGNVVQTFDTAAGTAIGSPTAVGTDPWATAITPDGTTAFVANQASGTVTPFTISSQSTGTNLCMPVGNCAAPDLATQPEAVAINPAGTLALVANSGENSVSQIILGLSLIHI